jgi:putative tricarboxylic transport membrane protein
MNTQDTSNSGPPHKAVEVGVAVLVIVFGAIAIIGSISAGIGWGAEGPRAGFFPFYIGIAIVISGGVNFWNAVRPDAPGGIFAEWSQLWQVMLVVIPATIYATAIANNALAVCLLLGVVVGALMRRFGRYSWPMVAIAAIGIPVLLHRWIAAALPDSVIGLYICSALFIGWFMRWLGQYRWPLFAAVAIGIPLLVYVVFEKYFLVSLPKGVAEEWLITNLEGPIRELNGQIFRSR